MKMTGMLVGNNLGKVQASGDHTPTTLSFPGASLCRRRGAGESEKLKIRCGRAYN